MEFIKLKDDIWLNKQRVAGKCVAECLSTSEELIKEDKGVSLKQIESVCLDIIKKHNCTPTFLNYKGFPGAICTSVNNELVHGIPRNYIIKSSDVVKIDLGATFEGAIADSAITVISGKYKNFFHKELVDACGSALTLGLRAIRVGLQVGEIGNAISAYFKKTPFKVITDYGGHGLDYDTPHSQPFIANKSRVDEGVRIQKGMTIAIEPMAVISSSKTRTSNDGWTVTTSDIGAHFEHTVYIHSDGVEIITFRKSDYLDSNFFNFSN